MRSEKYFRVSEASAAGACGGVEVVEFVDRNEGHVGVRTDAADRVGDVGDVAPGGDRQVEEPGELHRDHLGGGGRWDGDVDDRDVAGGVRVPPSVDHLDGLAELGERGGLAGSGGAGHHQAASSVVGVLVHLDQAAARGDDLADRGSLDHQQS